jgi:hypothetical protein
MSRNSTSDAIANIGLDIGKNVFHLVGLDNAARSPSGSRCRVVKSSVGWPLFRTA